jgi:hypothetical protein
MIEERPQNNEATDLKECAISCMTRGKGRSYPAVKTLL